MQEPMVVKNYVLIRIEKEFEDKLNIIGLDGEQLDFVGKFDNRNIRNYGVVEYVPKSLSSMPLPKYRYDGSEYERKRVTKVRDYDISIRVGDRIYCNFIYNNSNYRFKSPHNNEDLFAIPYEQCQCAIGSDGTITMLTDWIFLDIVEEGEEAMTTASGLYLKSAPDPIKNVGRVKYKPSWITDVNVGDYIAFDETGNWEYPFEGSKLYAMRYRDMLFNMGQKLDNSVLVGKSFS